MTIPGYRPFRVLAIGHCYIDTLPRQKWYALRDAAPECDIRVITPFAWPDPLGVIRSLPVAFNRLTFTPMRTVGAGYGSRYFYASADLIRVLREHSPDIIHIDHEPWAVVTAQIALLAKWLAPNARLVVFSWWNKARWIPLPWRPVHRWVLGRTALLQVGNQDAVGVHRAHGYRGPIVVMPQLGVGCERFHPGPADPRFRATISPSCCVVGYVGRLTREKAVDVLIEALAGLRDLDWHLMVVGSGPAAADLERLVAERGLTDRVSFVGAVLQERVADWMRCMDILVLPSSREWHEQFGHVLIEAMACGQAVVGSDSGEIPNTIGDAGLVFECGNHQQLARHLALLIRDPGIRRDYGARGRRRVLERYTDEVIARRLREEYHRLITPNVAVDMTKTLTSDAR